MSSCAFFCIQFNLEKRSWISFPFQQSQNCAIQFLCVFFWCSSSRLPVGEKIYANLITCFLPRSRSFRIIGLFYFLFCFATFQRGRDLFANTYKGICWIWWSWNFFILYESNYGSFTAKSPFFIVCAECVLDHAHTESVIEVAWLRLIVLIVYPFLVPTLYVTWKGVPTENLSAHNANVMDSWIVNFLFVVAVCFVKQWTYRRYFCFR